MDHRFRLTSFAFVASLPLPLCSSCQHVSPYTVRSKQRLFPKRARHAYNPAQPHDRNGLRMKWRAQRDSRNAPSSGSGTGFKWSVGTSRSSTIVDAIPEAVRKASSTFVLTKTQVTLAIIFVKSTFESNAKDEMRRVVPTLKKSLAMLGILAPDAIIYGCTTGASFDTEDDPTITVALSHLPASAATQIRTVRLAEDGFSLDWGQPDWHDAIGLPGGDVKSADGYSVHRLLFLLYHPDFTPRTRDLLAGLDFAYAGVRKVGAEAGRVNPLHEGYLFDAEGAIAEGALLLAVATPDVQVDVSVAQGVRGVGPLLEVIAVRDGTEITSVKETGTPGETIGAPMTLFDFWVKTDVVSLEDSRLAAKYLLFGTEVRDTATAASLAVAAAATRMDASEGKEGDKNIVPGLSNNEPVIMLSRRVVGVNEATRSIGVEGESVRLGSRARFQIRDDEAARAELTRLFDRLQLEASSKAMEGLSLMGALLLVDCERGSALHGNNVPDLDREMYRERFPVPLALMSSLAQIGPLPSGGLLGSAGDSFMLSASALYVSLYGRTGDPIQEE